MSALIIMGLAALLPLLGLAAIILLIGRMDEDEN